MKEIGYLRLTDTHSYIHTETALTIFRKHLPVQRLFHLQVARGHSGKMCVGVYVNMWLLQTYIVVVVFFLLLFFALSTTIISTTS